MREIRVQVACFHGILWVRTNWRAGLYDEPTRGELVGLDRWCGLRGSVVIDKSFLIMALAVVAAPLLGAGFYVVVHLF